jgi:IS5 family transposase
MQENMRYEMSKKQLRVERFLSEMEAVVPWQALVSEIKPFYKSQRGRRPHALELMLRIHFLQLWHNLSDPAMEEAIYDRYSFQNFLGFDCFGGKIPDESSICRFRHLLEQNGLSHKILFCVNNHLGEHGLVLKSGTIVDATLISAPVSKKNRAKKRDPEMSSTRKNNKWHFGAKGHIGVQANGKPIVHTVEFGTAKEHDIKQLKNLLHGNESAVFGDSAYSKQADKKAVRKAGIYYGISDKGARKHPLSNQQKRRNRKHSKLRCKVEHPFRVIKHLWGQTCCKYKGLAKNENWFRILCALSNLYFCRKDLMKLAG